MLGYVTHSPYLRTIRSRCGNPSNLTGERKPMAQLLSGLSQGSLSPVDQGDALHSELTEGAVWSMLQTGTIWDSLWDCTRLIMACFVEESKAGKRRDWGDLGRKKHGKIEDEGDKRSYLSRAGQYTCEP